MPWNIRRRELWVKIRGCQCVVQKNLKICGCNRWCRQKISNCEHLLDEIIFWSWFDEFRFVSLTFLDQKVDFLEFLALIFWVFHSIDVRLVLYWIESLLFLIFEDFKFIDKSRSWFGFLSICETGKSSHWLGFDSGSWDDKNFTIIWARKRKKKLLQMMELTFLLIAWLQI